MRPQITAFGRDVSVGVVSTLAATVIGGIAIAVWRSSVAHAATVTWNWLGTDASVARWALLLVGAGLLGVGRAAVLGPRWLTRRRDARRPASPPPPIAEAEHFRDAYAAFLRKFIPWFGAALAGGGYNETWYDEYVDLRRAALDALQAIRTPLREWLRRIDEIHTDPWRDEPVWVDQDGPDESLMAIIDRWLMPGDIGRAIGSWNGWNEADLRRLATERLDLVDSFVRSLRRAPDLDELDEDLSVLSRLRLAWRRRKARRARRRRQANPRRSRSRQ